MIHFTTRVWTEERKEERKEGRKKGRKGGREEGSQQSRQHGMLCSALLCGKRRRRRILFDKQAVEMESDNEREIESRMTELGGRDLSYCASSKKKKEVRK